MDAPEKELTLWSSFAEMRPFLAAMNKAKAQPSFLVIDGRLFVKWDETQHPRGERGRFVNAGGGDDQAAARRAAQIRAAQIRSAAGAFTPPAEVAGVGGTDAAHRATEARLLNLNLADAKRMDSGSSNGVAKIDHQAIVLRYEDQSDTHARANIPVKSNLERERAAYLVNEALGDYVDIPTVVIKGEGNDRTMLREYKEGKTPYDFERAAEKEPTINSHEIDRLALFDAVIGNSDRHIANYLIQQTPAEKFAGQAHLVGIDHGLSFPVSSGQDLDWYNQDMINQRVRAFDAAGGPKPSRADLTNAEKELLTSFVEPKAFTKLSAQLKPLVGQPAIDRMKNRVDKMLKSGKIIDTVKDF